MRKKTMRKSSTVMKRIMRIRITLLHGKLHLSQDMVDKHLNTESLSSKTPSQKYHHPISTSCMLKVV